jgi:uncharacterized protein YacL
VLQREGELFDKGVNFINDGLMVAVTMGRTYLDKLLRLSDISVLFRRITYGILAIMLAENK